jgi:ferrochelatase
MAGLNESNGMKIKHKTGVLLVNLGTPDSPKPADVKKYLLEFLTDDRVIDFGWFKRNLLVRGIIVPFRYKKSAKLYKAIWDDKNGSPLLFHTRNLLQKVKQKLPEDYVVEMAMRYQSPSIENGLEALRAQQVDDIIVLPLFPHYASSSSGSTVQKAYEVVSKWNGLPGLRFIKCFYDHPKFIQAFVNKIKEHNVNDYDHVVFSYHGLPERHMKKVDETGKHCLQENYACCDSICGANRLCYRAQCKATTDLLAEALGWKQENYTMSFQSRLGRDPWVKPYTDLELKRLAEEGKKKVLVICPAFVADCLETIYEIGVEYQEEFESFGGEKVQLVESLNDSDDWVDTVVELVLKG